MQRLCTATQMRAMDKEAMHGRFAIAPAVLMENAGHAVVDKARRHIGGWCGKDVLICCGKGNNGGDGFVIARHLLTEGARVYVYVLGQEERYSDESRQHLATLRQLENKDNCIVTMYTASDGDDALLCQRLGSVQVVVDAILGTGFSGSLRGTVAHIVDRINEYRTYGTYQVVAVDIPTGVNTDTGAVSGDGTSLAGRPVQADVTVTFGQYKRGLFFYPGREFTGIIERDFIGMPLPLLRQHEADDAYILEERDMAAFLPPRRPDSHKGSHGNIAIVSGSSDMAGAALMAGRGALRSGAGKIYLRVPQQAAPYCIGRQPEIMVRGIGHGAAFGQDDAAAVLAEAAAWSVIAMGPGMGTRPETKDFLKMVISGSSCPIVIDADGLNLLAGERDFIRTYGSRIIMTPHLAEFSRLSGLSIPEIRQDTIGAAKAFAADWQVTVLVKGAPTVIVNPISGTAYVNPTGNAGMATGGMGDILTGMIASFVAHDGVEALWQAAVAGAYVHGAAGDSCFQALGPYGYSPVEVADAVPQVLQHMEAARVNPVGTHSLLY